MSTHSVGRWSIIFHVEHDFFADYETDQAIQKFIRTEFNDASMIIVAHRLQTIMDSDKIVSLTDPFIRVTGV